MFVKEKMIKGKFTSLFIILMSIMLLVVLCPQPVLAAGATATIWLYDANGNEIETVTEYLINKSGFKIQIELVDTEWSKKLVNEGDTEVDLGKIGSILGDMFTAKQHPDQWDNVIQAIEKVEYSKSNKALTITVPKMDDKYSINSNEQITVKIPPALLEDYTKTVEIKGSSFDIYANPRAFIEGSITTATASDIRKGGEVLQIRLLNAAWNKGKIETTTGLHELLGKFVGGKWGVVVDAIKKDPTKVSIKSDNRILEIKLPPAPDYKISGSETVTFKAKDLGEGSEQILNFDGVFKDIEGMSINSPQFTIKPSSDQAAVISGSILTNTTDFDIASGGKEITITLRNDTWKKGFDVDTLLNGFKFNGTGISDGEEKWDSFIANADNTIVTKNRDDEVTIKFNKNADFKLSEDIEIQPKIVKDLLNIANNDITDIPAFKIAAVKAELSGTALQGLDAADVVKGGKTIIITLKNATWADVENAELIDIFNVEKNDPWEKVKDALKANPSNIKRSKDKVTIKLPPVPGYTLDDGGEIVSIDIPYSLIKEAPQGESIDHKLIAGKITIGQVASATIEHLPITESDIINGEAIFTITLKDAQWVEDLPNNTKVKNALIKGFTVQDQQNEWKPVSAALPKAKMELDNDRKTLTITIPAVPQYAIVRDQQVQITIPKTAMVNGKYNIPAGSLTIEVPPVSEQSSLAEKLIEGNFDEYIKDKDLTKIRVNVPTKIVETIKLNTVNIPMAGGENTTITTIEVFTASDTGNNVGKVVVTIPQGDSEEIIKEAKGNSPFTFVFQNLQPNSEMKIAVYNNGDELLQTEIYKKITKGNKVYNELPKKRLDGSYSFYSLLTSKSLFQDILKYYPVSDLKIGKAS